MIIRIANHHYDHHHHQLVTGANSFQQLCELLARLTVCQKAVKFLPLQQWYSPSSLFSFPVTSLERFLLLLLLQLSTLLLTWHGHCVTLTNSSNTWHFNQTHTHTHRFTSLWSSAVKCDVIMSRAGGWCQFESSFERRWFSPYHQQQHQRLHRHR